MKTLGMRLAGTLLLLFVGYGGFFQLPKVENNQLVLENVAMFKSLSAELTEEGSKTLQQVKDFLLAKEFISLLRIETHTDNSGSEAANQELSEKRSLAAARWLVTHGIDCKRLVAVGFGSTKPVSDNATPAAKEANRRTIFVLAAMNGRLIGGMPADGGGNPAGDSCVQ